MSAWEAAIQYKQLWTVEEIFRTMKSVLDTRPIYHHCTETIRGHVFCSFLALVLRNALHDKLEKKQWKLERADIINDIDKIEEIEITHQSKKFVIRTALFRRSRKGVSSYRHCTPPGTAGAAIPWHYAQTVSITR